MRTLLLASLVACSGTATPPAKPEPVSPELSPALAPLNWWLGDWQVCQATPQMTEHWTAVSGAMYGVGFSNNGFEVMIVDDGEGAVSDGILRFIAMPQGARSVEFTAREAGDRTITFANPDHDDPKQITYARDGANLRAVLFGTSLTKVDFCPGTHQAAPELEAADRQFNAETRAHGIEGWVAAFDSNGGMMRRGSRIEGADAIRAAMTDTLTNGRLTWDPVASARAGTIGFTVGKATYTGKDSWESSYVTIWRQQPDGSWKVLFDTGRAVQKPQP